MKKIQFLTTKNIIFFACLTLFLGFTSCSSDDDGDEVENSASPYWVLGIDNKNMPSSGTIIAQYSDASSDYDIGKLVDDNVNTKYLTYHSSFDITWNGNSSIAVESYSLTSAVDSPEMDPKSWTLSGSTDGKS